MKLGPNPYSTANPNPVAAPGKLETLDTMPPEKRAAILAQYPPRQRPTPSPRKFQCRGTRIITAPYAGARRGRS